MIRVLIVEDSPTIRIILESILESDPQIKVVGRAANGIQAIRQAQRLKPDLITMDICMPLMDGFEATHHIMALCPTPIVVVSARLDKPGMRGAFDAIRAGALDVVQKPVSLCHRDYEAIQERLICAVKLMSQVKVVQQRRASKSFMAPARGRHKAQLVVVGASTGGPSALNILLKSLPADFPLPIVIVQHISTGFMQGLVSWLQLESQLPIAIAKGGQCLPSSGVIFAPDNYHLKIKPGGILSFSQDQVVPYRPSANVLFNSAVDTYGADVIGILLTGMGEDGAVGLKKIRDEGGTTFVQNEATSVVYGMPKMAVQLGAADHILPIHQIGPTLLTIVRGD